MAWFGDSMRERLERERDELAARLERTEQQRDELAARLERTEQERDELRRGHQVLERGLSELRARLDRLRSPTRTPSRVPTTSTAIEVHDDDEVARATYAFQATPAQLEALDLMFRMIASAGQWGSTIYFDVMVDGDGAAQVRVCRDDEELGLTDEEARAWFLDEELPEHARVLDVHRRDGVICIELV